MDALILAAGRGSRLRPFHHRPKGFVQLAGQPIIERSIHLLRQAGIGRIVIVTGYGADHYQELAGRLTDLELVHNENYTAGGSLRTLLLAAEAITGDFLLLESDIVYEPRALSAVLAAPAANVLLVSGPTQAGDEWYVEATAGRFVATSNDPAQLNNGRIIGEWVGISRLSLPFYRQVVTLCRHHLPHPAERGYEEGLTAAGRTLPLTCLLIPDLLWAEIDTGEQYRRAERLLFPSPS